LRTKKDRLFEADEGPEIGNQDSRRTRSLRITRDNKKQQCAGDGHQEDRFQRDQSAECADKERRSARRDSYNSGRVHLRIVARYVGGKEDYAGAITGALRAVFRSWIVYSRRPACIWGPAPRPPTSLKPAFDTGETHAIAVFLNVYAYLSDMETAGCVQIVKPPRRWFHRFASIVRLGLTLRYAFMREHLARQRLELIVRER